MGIKKGYRSAQEGVGFLREKVEGKGAAVCGRFWAWLRSLMGEPRAALRHPPSAEARQPGNAALPCQALPLSREADGEEIDLYQLWQVVWGARKFIALFTFVCTFSAVLVTLFVLPVTYKSEAVLMPIDTQSGDLGRLAGLAASLPLPVNLSGGGKSYSIANFLNSRTLKERLLTKYDLLPRLFPDLWDAEKKVWLVEKGAEKPSIVKVLQGKTELHQVAQDIQTNLITLSWEDKDPAFAALMLNRIIGELQYYLDNEYESDAKRERQFVEQQLAKVTRELNHWEQQVPAENLPLAKIQRERLAVQSVYAELRKQLELARISEAKELVRFKVLDPPLVPEKRFKPKRTLICAAILVLSGFLSIFLVFAYRAVWSSKEAAAMRARHDEGLDREAEQ